MGQKVNPIGLRLGINRGWDSVWFSKKREYGKFLIEDYKIREYVKKNVVNSGVSQVLIERTSKKCIVSIYTSRPGFVIGKKGSDIDKIKKNLAKISSTEISLNIKEVKKPELNAYLVAENIAQQLVKRIAFRKTMKRAIQSALRLGAKGIKVCLSGRLGGNEIARTEWQREGSVPLHTFRADVDYAEAEALTTYGIIGVKVWIYKGEILSNNLNKDNKEKRNGDLRCGFVVLLHADRRLRRGHTRRLDWCAGKCWWCRHSHVVAHYTFQSSALPSEAQSNYGIGHRFLECYVYSGRCCHGGQTECDRGHF